jgi:hypothetical protein
MGMLNVLLAGTGITAFNVLLDKSPHGGPPVLVFDTFEGGVDARMS